MKKHVWPLLFLFLSSFLLTACTGDAQSVQLGIVKNEKDVELLTPVLNTAHYDEMLAILGEARNFKMVEENELNTMKNFYIQFSDVKQGIIVANYIMWNDQKNNRIITTPYVASSHLFYEVTGEDYDKLKEMVIDIR